MQNNLNPIESMDIIFKPEKKWWQFWKRSKKLKRGKDFEIENGVMKLTKYNTKGEYTVNYNYLK